MSMESVHHQEFPRTADEARRQIESLLDEVAELADSAAPTEVFYEQLLDRLTFATTALGAAIWTKSPGGHLMLAYQTELTSIYPRGQAAQAVADDQACLYPIFLQGAPDTCLGNAKAAKPYELFAVPLRVAGELWGILALYEPAELTKSVKGTYLRIAGAFGEVAQHFQQQSLLRDFQQHRVDWKRQLDFADLVHTDLSYQKTAYRVANEARNCLDADRVAVLTLRGNRCRLDAISGVDRPNHRSNTVRKLEELTATVVRSRQTLLYTGDAENLPPQVEVSLRDYLEETPSRIIAIIPLVEIKTVEETGEAIQHHRASESIGALVVESIEQLNGHDLLRRTEPIARHAATALGNARAYQQLPLASVLAPLGHALATVGWYRLSTTLKVVVPLLVLLTATFLIPADFSIEVYGKLVPQVERNLFAPANGYVEEIFVRHGDQVAEGDPLIQLRSNEFALQRAEIVGELQTAQAQLDAILVKRSQGLRRDSRSTPESQSYENLSADEMRLTKQIENFIERRDLLQRRDKELKLISPIAGQVLDWEVDQVLTARPVSRGELLMKVADVNGPWVLELELPDRRTYHVVTAQRQASDPLTVRFQLVNEPGKQYRGVLTQTASVVDLDETSDEPFVPLVANFDKAEIPHLRHGLSVVGRVECGRRSIAYVWTYQLLETVRRRLFW